MTLLRLWKVWFMGTFQHLGFFFLSLAKDGRLLWYMLIGAISNSDPDNGGYNTPGATFLNDPNCHCALRNSFWPSPHKVLSYTEGGLLWRCFKWLHNHVRRMAACHGVVSWFCKLDILGHPKNISVLQDTGSDMRFKAPFRPPPTSTGRSVCRLCGASKSVGRRAVEGEQRPKKHRRIGSVDRVPSTHKMDKKRRVVAQAASTRTSTLHLWCQRAPCGNIGNARPLLAIRWNCVFWIQAVTSRTSAATMEPNT